VTILSEFASATPSTNFGVCSMPPQQSSTSPPLKIGPPIGVRKSKRLNATATSPTKVQPRQCAKSRHSMINCKYYIFTFGSMLCLSFLQQPQQMSPRCMMLRKRMYAILLILFYWCQLIDLSFQIDQPTSVARCPTIQLRPRRLTKGLTNEEHEEEYLNSFRTKMVTLKDGKKLECQIAIDQLHAGMISREDIIDEDGCIQ